MGREVDLATYRRAMQATSFVSVALFAVGLYLVVTATAWVAGLVLVVAGVAVLLSGGVLRIRPDPASLRELVLVSKRDCLLCAEAKTRLAPEAGRRGLRVREVLLEDHAALRRAYAAWVPVLLWQNDEIAKGIFDWAEIGRRLDEVARKASEHDG